MAFNLIVSPLAKRDLQDAYEWYEEQSEGLGERFLNNLDEAFDELLQNPFYAVQYDSTRCLPVRIFPYMIHFYVNGERDIIYIVAIFHTKMNDTKWGKR
jgi:toxin ParE1/3/4